MEIVPYVAGAIVHLLWNVPPLMMIFPVSLATEALTESPLTVIVVFGLITYLFEILPFICQIKSLNKKKKTA